MSVYMFIYTYVYIVQKRPSQPIPRPCHTHKLDTSPAFQQYLAEEIGYTTPIIFNWVLTATQFNSCSRPHILTAAPSPHNTI